MRYIGFVGMTLLMMAFLVGVFVCAGVGIYRWFEPLWRRMGGRAFAIGYGVLVVLVLGVFVAGRTPGNPIPAVIHKIDHYAMGFLVYGVLFVDVVSAVLFLLGKLNLCPNTVSIVSGRVAVVLFLVVCTYGCLHAWDLQTKRYEVQLVQSGEATEEFKIVLITDLHLGYVMDAKRLEEIVARVNEESPDLVCVAGDIFDGDYTAVQEPEEIRNLFNSIEATYGVYACLGNHDAGGTYNQMIDFLAGTQIHLLRDEATVIAEKLVLVGRRDSSPIGGHGDERSAVDALIDGAELPVVVMDHQPGNIGEYDEKTDLILCGHTHQGQIVPFNLITGALFDVDYGYYRASENSPQVIVTSGAGTWGPPQRIGTDCEVVSISLMLP